MSAGTKVTIAVIVLFAAMMGVYYVFGGPGTGAASDVLPPADVDRTDPGLVDESLPPSPVADLASQPPGVLSASVEQAIGDEQTPAAHDLGILAGD